MKIKKAIALMLCIILVLCFAGCTKKPSDFRNANFGMSVSEVTKKENVDFVYASDNLLFYTTTMNAEDSEIYYYFVDGKLSEAECKFIIDGRTIDENIARFERMTAYLTSLYGEPVNPDFNRWLTEDEEQKLDRPALLIYNQFLEYYLEWQTETAHISLLLNYKDAQINYVYAAEAIAQE